VKRSARSLGLVGSNRLPRLKVALGWFSSWAGSFVQSVAHLLRLADIGLAAARFGTAFEFSARDISPHRRFPRSGVQCSKIPPCSPHPLPASKKSIENGLFSRMRERGTARWQETRHTRHRESLDERRPHINGSAGSDSAYRMQSPSAIGCFFSPDSGSAGDLWCRRERALPGRSPVRNRSNRASHVGGRRSSGRGECAVGCTPPAAEGGSTLSVPDSRANRNRIHESIARCTTSLVVHR